jgi:hypothetical protein
VTYLRAWACVGLWLWLWASSLPAAATTTLMTQAQAFAAADVVVEGTVVSAQSQWVGHRIITFVVVVAGHHSYAVAMPGGVVEGIAQAVAGAPVLHVGHRYRLALGKGNGPLHSRGVVGLGLGVVELPSTSLIDDDGHLDADQSGLLAP